MLTREYSVEDNDILYWMEAGVCLCMCLCVCKHTCVTKFSGNCSSCTWISIRGRVLYMSVQFIDFIKQVIYIYFGLHYTPFIWPHKKAMLKSPTVVKNLDVSLFSFVSFCFMNYVAVQWGIYKLGWCYFSISPLFL